MIIGLSGKQGTGKTTVANMLLDAFREYVPCVRMAFGDALKREASFVYNFPLSWAYVGKSRVVEVPACEITSEWRDKDVTVREILQHRGMEMRKVNPDYWIEKLDAATRVPYKHGVRIIIVDDVRFPNEFEYVRVRGMCYRLEPYQGYDIHSNHYSESALDLENFDRRFCPKFGRNYLEKVAESIVNMVLPIYQKCRKFRYGARKHQSFGMSDKGIDQ